MEILLTAWYISWYIVPAGLVWENIEQYEKNAGEKTFTNFDKFLFSFTWHLWAPAILIIVIVNLVIRLVKWFSAK